MVLKTLMMPKNSVSHFVIIGVIHYFKNSSSIRRLPMASPASPFVSSFPPAYMADLYLINSPCEFQPIEYVD